MRDGSNAPARVDAERAPAPPLRQGRPRSAAHRAHKGRDDRRRLRDWRSGWRTRPGTAAPSTRRRLSGGGPPLAAAAAARASNQARLSARRSRSSDTSKPRLGEMAAQARGIDQEAGGAVRRPRRRVADRPARPLQDVVDDERAAGPQHPGDLGVEALLVRGCSSPRAGCRRRRSWRPSNGRSTASAVRKRTRSASPQRRVSSLATSTYSGVRSIADHPVAARRRQEPGRAAEAAADVEQLGVDRGRQQLGQLDAWPPGRASGTRRPRRGRRRVGRAGSLPASRSAVSIRGEQIAPAVVRDHRVGERHVPPRASDSCPDRKKSQTP